jgi:hypothetical protein
MVCEAVDRAKSLSDPSKLTNVLKFQAKLHSEMVEARFKIAKVEEYENFKKMVFDTLSRLFSPGDCEKFFEELEKSFSE